MATESGIGKHNSRKKRTHERKRSRYRARMWRIFTREGAKSARLGRKLRKLASTPGGLRMN